MHSEACAPVAFSLAMRAMRAVRAVRAMRGRAVEVAATDEDIFDPPRLMIEQVVFGRVGWVLPVTGLACRHVVHVRSASSDGCL